MIFLRKIKYNIRFRIHIHVVDEVYSRRKQNRALERDNVNILGACSRWGLATSLIHGYCNYEMLMLQ